MKCPVLFLCQMDTRWTSWGAVSRDWLFHRGCCGCGCGWVEWLKLAFIEKFFFYLHAFHQLRFFREGKTMVLTCNRWNCLNKKDTTEFHNIHCLCCWKTHIKRVYINFKRQLSVVVLCANPIKSLIASPLSSVQLSPVLCRCSVQIKSTLSYRYQL